MNEEQILVIPSPEYESYFNKCLGASLGAAVADALGWITEFRSSWQELDENGIRRIDDYITWTKATGGRFHTYFDYISKGEYSDDTQLTLCTARSLRQDGSFDPNRFVAEMKAWLDYARGAGAAITAAARNLRSKGQVRWNENFHGIKGRGKRQGYLEAGGNGAAMRIAPHALANPKDPRTTFVGSWSNAIITHGHPRAIVGAVTMAEALRFLTVNGGSETRRHYTEHLRGFIDNIAVPDDEAEIAAWQTAWEMQAAREFKGHLQSTKLELDSMIRQAADTKVPFIEVLESVGCFKPSTRGSGTGTVAAAIAAFYRWPADYKTGVLEIVNTRGIDTDTIAAMYGSLVGVRVGSTRIPDRWSIQMQDYDYFLAVADALTKIATRTAVENELVVDLDMVENREHDILELTQGRTVTKNQRVIHPLLGPGWVRSVSEQRIKSGGLMLLADVTLDSGQTMRFRSHKGSAGRSAKSSSRKPRPTARDSLL